MNAQAGHRIDPFPGVIAALVLFCAYGGLALSVDFPRAAFGFHSDEATYYMMGLSLANDRDLAYRREDLMRVWREFPSGPSGVFLKKGRDLEVRWGGRFPFVHVESRPDPDAAELFYGKSYVYPLVAAPMVRILGTNGFLLLHALLLGAMLLAGYLFLNARSSPGVSLVLAAGFLMASVAPAYFVWITPELFNLSFVFLGYFCWLYKEVMPGDRAPRGTRWLLGAGSDLMAALLLGVATFSKPSNLLLILPVLAWMVYRRRWKRALATGLLFGLCGVALLAGNVATTGEWNYQGGDRRTFYGPYPFQDRQTGWEGVGQDRVTSRVMTEVIFDRRVFWTVFSRNLAYFAVGRYSGLVPYFFPAVFSAAAFLLARRRRTGWQWLIGAAAAAEILLLVVWIPYNYFGGGGVLGNRYFMNTYGVFFFLLPAIESMPLALLPWAVGCFFSAQIALNPFVASYNPAEPAKRGPLRLLPVELTLVNDLPTNTQANRARVWFGQERRFQIYFLDDNAYAREGLGFWVRGHARAEFLVKTVEPATALDLTLTAGNRDVRVTARRGWSSRSADLRQGQTTTLTIPLDDGFPYLGTRVWTVSVSTDSGFVPLFGSTPSEDTRFLGVQVTPELRR
ncbi:MAG: hypothetical protein AB1806_06640 [Acidobacteriota bacterium]